MTTLEEQLKELRAKSSGASNTYAEAVKTSTDANIEAMKAENAALLAQMDAAEAERAAAAKQYESDFYGLLQAQKKDNEEQNNESIQAEDAAQKTALFSGGLEATNALIGLIGTMNGGSPQTYHAFSKDWMAKADQERRAREARMAQQRREERTLQDKYNQLVYGNAKDSASAKLNRAKTAYEQNNKIASAEAAGALAQAELANQNIQTEVNNELTDLKTVRTADETQANNSVLLTLANGGEYSKVNMPIATIEAIVRAHGSARDIADWESAKGSNNRSAFVTIAQKVAGANSTANKKLLAGVKKNTASTTETTEVADPDKPAPKKGTGLEGW